MFNEYQHNPNNSLQSSDTITTSNSLQSTDSITTSNSLRSTDKSQLKFDTINPNDLSKQSMITNGTKQRAWQLTEADIPLMVPIGFVTYG